MRADGGEGRDALPRPFPSACRGCGTPIRAGLLDLGLQPLATAPLPAAVAAGPVATIGLELLQCEACGLLQPAHRHGLPAAPVPVTERGLATLISRLQLHPSLPVTVLEEAGPGWLPMLRRFGFDPSLAPSGAAAALAWREAHPPPVLLLAGEVFGQLASRPDSLRAIRELLAPGGIAVLDLPDLLALVQGLRFDLMEPEPEAWPSLLVAELLLYRLGLTVFGLQRGSGRLRLLACHQEDRGKPEGPEVAARREAEREAGFDSGQAFAGFAAAAREARAALFELLLGMRREGRLALGLGAGPAAVRLLAAGGIGSDLLPAILQPGLAGPGQVLPGSRVPLLPLEMLAEASPDLVVVLDGRPAAEARAALCGGAAPGVRLALPLPRLRILPLGG